MKRPLAYITAAWCGIPEVDTDLAVEFCRAAYEAGLAPICPKLYLPLILNDNVPEEHKDGIDMGRDMLKRSRMLLVCGGDCGRGREKRHCGCRPVWDCGDYAGRHYEREGAGLPGQCRILSWGASLTG